MKLIYLNIDGVMNVIEDDLSFFPTHTAKIRALCPSSTHIKYLNEIIAETDAQVVITSTWRRSISALYLNMLFSLCGFTGIILDITPVLHGQRDIEIASHRECYNRLHPKDRIENYVVIDDVKINITYIDNFIKINPEKGLQSQDAKKAIQLLNEV